MKVLPALLALLLACSSSSGGSGEEEDDDGAGGSGGEQSAGRGGSGGAGRGGSGGKGGGGASGSNGGNGGEKPMGGSGGSGGGAGSSGAGGSGGVAGNTAQGGAGGSVSGGGGKPAAPGCLEFKVQIRDFQSNHSDFQDPTITEANTAVPFVQKELGSDGNPRLEPGKIGPAVKDAASFAQWWQDAPGLNKSVELTIKANPRGKLYQLGGDDSGWYPIDGKGFGNADFVAPDMPKDAEQAAVDAAHNQLFTAKIEAEFYYQGGAGETIISESDDDSWVFINGRLAVDNGGLHGFMPASVNLDRAAEALGIKPGNRYKVSFFYAERLFGGAFYRVSSNLLYTHCESK